MTKNVDLGKIKARILALTQKTVENGCTEGEVVAALLLIGKLLVQYDLSMDEVDLRDEPCVTQNFVTKFKNLSPVGWCVVAIAGLTDTRVWKEVIDGKMNYRYFGMESDVQMAVYLTSLIETAIHNETENFKLTPAYITQGAAGVAYSSLNASFKRGMTNRLSTRLNQMKVQKNSDMAAEAASRAKTTGTSVNSLVVVKNAIVTEAFAKMNLRLRGSNSKSRVGNNAAFSSGRDAAEKVNLSRPLGGGATSSGYTLLN